MGWVNPRAIGWARRQVVGSKVQKLVLLVLASYCTTANDCQVTVQTLARDCEIAERSLQRALRSLSKRQLITIRPCFRNGRNRPNTYALNLPTGEGGGLPPRGGADDIATPAADPDKGGAGATPTTRTALSNQLLLQPQQQPRSHDLVPELPAALDAELRARALSLLARAPPGTAQDVADEWIARWRTGTLRNPLAYLAKLVRQTEAVRFHPGAGRPGASQTARTKTCRAQSARAGHESTLCAVERAYDRRGAADCSGYGAAAELSAVAKKKAAPFRRHLRCAGAARPLPLRCKP